MSQSLHTIKTGPASVRSAWCASTSALFASVAAHHRVVSTPLQHIRISDPSYARCMLSPVCAGLVLHTTLEAGKQQMLSQAPNSHKSLPRQRGVPGHADPLDCKCGSTQLVAEIGAESSVLKDKHRLQQRGGSEAVQSALQFVEEDRPAKAVTSMWPELVDQCAAAEKLAVFMQTHWMVR